MFQLLAWWTLHILGLVGRLSGCFNWFSAEHDDLRISLLRGYIIHAHWVLQWNLTGLHIRNRHCITGAFAHLILTLAFSAGWLLNWYLRQSSFSVCDGSYHWNDRFKFDGGLQTEIYLAYSAGWLLTLLFHFTDFYLQYTTQLRQSTSSLDRLHFWILLAYSAGWLLRLISPDSACFCAGIQHWNCWNIFPAPQGFWDQLAYSAGWLLTFQSISIDNSDWDCTQQYHIYLLLTSVFILLQIAQVLHFQFALAYSAGWLLILYFGTLDIHDRVIELRHLSLLPAQVQPFWTALAYSAGWLLIVQFAAFTTFIQLINWQRCHHLTAGKVQTIWIALAYSAGWLLILQFVTTDIFIPGVPQSKCIPLQFDKVQTFWIALANSAGWLLILLATSAGIQHGADFYNRYNNLQLEQVLHFWSQLAYSAGWLLRFRYWVQHLSGLVVQFRHHLLCAVTNTRLWTVVTRILKGWIWYHCELFDWFHLLSAVLHWICNTLAFFAGWLPYFCRQTAAASLFHFASTACSPRLLSDRLQFHRHPSVSRSAFDTKPGPKSGHIWRSRPVRCFLIGFLLVFIMHPSARYGGEGSGSVMGVTETSVLHSDQIFLSSSDVKPHDTRPPACSAVQSQSLTSVQKRSLKRAHRRACSQGIAWYKGRLYKPEDFFFMPAPAMSQASDTGQFSPQKANPMCHKIHGSKSRVTCMQWNIGGLSNHRLDELKTWLAHNSIQVVTLLETRWQFTGEWVDADWIHVHSGSQTSKGMGILTMVSKRLCNATDLRWNEIVVGRLVHLRLPSKGRSFDLLCGYQHVDKRSPQCMQLREQWWRQLDTTLQQLPHRNHLLVMADFNTNIPSCPPHSGSEWYRWKNCLTKGSQHQDAGRLMSLLRFHGLVVLNSWNARDGPTYVHGSTSSRIDYALVRRNQVDAVSKQPRYLWQAPFMAPQQFGHVPIVHQIAMFWTRTCALRTGEISRQQAQQAKLEFQADSAQWQAYLAHSAAVMARSLTQVLYSEDHLDTQMAQFHETVNACFSDFFPPVKVAPKIPAWQHSSRIIMTKWQHRASLMNVRTCTGAGVFRAWYHFARYSFLKRQQRRHAAQIRRLHFSDIVKTAQIAAQKHDMHKMFSLINRYAPKTARRRIQIRNASGAIATPPEELDLLKQFVQDIWGGPNTPPMEFAQAPGVPFTVSVLSHALSEIPLNRAVARPFAPGIAWRNHGSTIAPILHQILCCWWGTNPPFIPQCWKDGWMIMLGKPQKPPHSYYNLRPIALQDPVGKALVGLLIQCACRDAKHHMLPWPLWAYMPMRSTLDAICRVSFHCHQVAQLIASQRPTPHARAAALPTFQFCGGVTVMLDLERAFDGVSREKLFGQLQQLQIRPSVIQLLAHWHHDTRYHFQHGLTEVALPTGAGLRQGCKAAPGLWNCLMLLYLQRVASLLPATWLMQHLNIYADDYQVGGLFYSVSDLEKLLTAIGILLETLKEFSLRINTKKSAALLNIAGTSHRHLRAQFVLKQKDQEQLRIPLPSGTEALIPLQQRITYLGTVMTYKDCQAATLKHRLTLARIAQRRLGRWLRGKHDFSIANRFHLWKSTVMPVLTYGLFATGISTSGIATLQREMYKMIRQVVGDHASRTGHPNWLALQLRSIATPLQQLCAAAKQLLQSITQRCTKLTTDDITLQLPWDHLSDLVHKLATAQELSPQPVEPSSLRIDPSSQDIFQCAKCDFVASDVATFRRHCTMVHGNRVCRGHFALASNFTDTGLPECKYCGKIFTTWRQFQTHIDRGCQVLFSGPCATETHTPLGAQLYLRSTEMAAAELAVRGSTVIPESDLENLRNASFGLPLCQLIEERAWDRLDTMHEACQYLATRCILCGLHYNRVQELNAHYRTMHGQFFDGVPQQAVYMSNTWATERPCGYCGALFKSHLCPVWVQVMALLMYGARVPHDVANSAEAPSPSVRCVICLADMPDTAALSEHMQTQHALQGMAFNVARDSVAGSPACAHCGTLYDNLSSLRSHINQSRCLLFRPEATPESLPMRPEWIQACTAGEMKVLFTNARSRMELTLHCQLCGVRYSRSTDLSGHLQGSHARVWRRAQQLLVILTNLFYARGTCVCNPALHQQRLDHNCLPLRQLAMLFQLMDDKILAPFQVSETVLQMLISDVIAPEQRFSLEQIVVRHDYAQLWQDSGCLLLLRSQCIFCGCARDASALPQHLREAHACSHLALAFYLSLLVPLMQKSMQVDYQCHACLQIFNLPADENAQADPQRNHLAQSHLLHNCPVALQIALLLSGLLYDGRLLDDADGPTCSTASVGNLQGAGSSVWTGIWPQTQESQNAPSISTRIHRRFPSTRRCHWCHSRS